MFVQNDKENSQTRNFPVVFFPSPVLTLVVSQYRKALMCFQGKMANLTSEVSALAGSTRLPLTGQAEGAHPDFTLYVV